MTRKRMRKFLRKPRPQKSLSKDWGSLLDIALERAHANEIPFDDPRFVLLRGGTRDPEKTLRRLSIVTLVDITREFGPES